MKFCGIDPHSNNSVVVVSDADDRIVLQRRLPNDLDAILALTSLAALPRLDRSRASAGALTFNADKV
jgi:hypothetical protein